MEVVVTVVVVTVGMFGGVGKIKKRLCIGPRA